MEEVRKYGRRSGEKCGQELENTTEKKSDDRDERGGKKSMN
jgi:hypothetical protein